MQTLASSIAALAILGGVAWIVLRAPLALSRRIWIVVLTLVLGGGVTMMVAHSFVAKWAFMGDHPRHGLLLLMDGTAHRPFVYRRLAPDLVRLATDAALERLPARAIDYFVNRSPLRRYRENWSGIETWTPRKAVAFHFAYALVWSSLFGTLLAGAGLIRTIFKAPWLEALVTASVGMCFVPLMYVGGGYLYDATELLLWFTLLFCFFRGWIAAVPILFALMLTNKESALTVVPALFPLFYRRAGAASALKWTGLLGAMGLGWVWFVRTKYAALPGAPMEWWLPDNLAFWARPSSYFSFAQLHSPGLLSPRGANVLLLLLLFIPLRHGWTAIRADVRYATALLALALVPLFLAFSYNDEIRNLSLLYPFLFVVSVAGVHALFARQTGSAASAASSPVSIDGGDGPVRRDAAI